MKSSETTIPNNKCARKPVYIVGPTASGKSEFAYRLAQEIDGVIISADSMQIYRGLDIGTAKDSKERRSCVPYKMIDIVDFTDEYSVAEYATAARNEIEAALNSGKMPIIVGGTGLYFEALFYPMSFASISKNTELRSCLEKEYEESGGVFMHSKLQELDPESAQKLHPNDKKRIIRALEIALTGQKNKYESRDVLLCEPDVVCVGFNTERAVLYNRINARVDEMFNEGLLDEVTACLQKDATAFCRQSMQAIGYKEFADCFNAEINDSDITNSKNNNKFIIPSTKIAEIKDNIKKHTRNYAKRQITWFKRYKFVKWFECGDFESAKNYIMDRLTEEKQQ